MSDELREAAQVILDRCLDFFGGDDLDPESSEAMPVVIKNRWVYDLRAALAALAPAAAPAAREDPRPAGPWTGDPADYNGDEGR